MPNGQIDINRSFAKENMWDKIFILQNLYKAVVFKVVIFIIPKG